MYTGFKLLHSTYAFIVLALLLISVIFSFFCFVLKQPYSKVSKFVFLVTLALSHIQMLIGFVLYFLSPLGASSISNLDMKNAIQRLYVIEHPITMLIALVCITLGYSKSKRALLDNKKYSFIFYGYGIGLLLILARIPWHAW